MTLLQKDAQQSPQYISVDAGDVAMPAAEARQVSQLSYIYYYKMPRYR